MPSLTSGQLSALKTNIAANTATVVVDGQTVQINSVADIGAGADAIAAWYNGFPGTDFWTWRSDVRRGEIYVAAPAEATTWGWVGFKNQAVAEQNTWLEMFMPVASGQPNTCNFGNANNRQGVLDIFGTSGAGGSNRTHIFNSVRRKATNAEKLFSTPVTGAPANTGNDNTVGNQGKTTNPNVMAFEGSLTGQQIVDAMHS